MIDVIEEARRTIAERLPGLPISDAPENARGGWPCVVLRDGGNHVRKGEQSVKINVAVYAANEAAADYYGELIDEELRGADFFRLSSRIEREALGFTWNVVFTKAAPLRNEPFLAMYEANGESVLFSTCEDSGSAFSLTSVDGLYPVESAVRTVSNGNAPICVSVSVLPKMITLNGILPRGAPPRRRLMKCMAPLIPGFLYVGGRRLMCYPVKTPEFYEDNAFRFKLTLAAPVPFFEDVLESAPITLAGFAGGVSFPLEIIEKFAFGSYVTGSAVDIQNAGDTEVGMNIRMKALGSVENPCVTNMVSGEFMRFNMTLYEGEGLVISTAPGGRACWVMVGGTETNAMPYLDPASTFLTLKLGVNLLRVSADSGADMLEAESCFKQKYVGP